MAKQRRQDTKIKTPVGPQTSSEMAVRGEAAVPAPEEKRPAWVIPFWPAALLLAAVSFGLYADTLSGGMVNWDDSIVTSAWKKQLSFSLVIREFLHLSGSYQPVRNLSHVLDHALFGPNLWWFHIHSVFLYALNAVCLYAFLLHLFGFTRTDRSVDRPVVPGEARSPAAASVAAFVAALLFVVHPVHVEAVAWLVGRKEVLFGLFFSVSLLCWVKRDRMSGDRAAVMYLAAFFFYALSLLSKPAAASLPFLILAYDLILLRPPAREWRRRVLLHVPFWLPLAGATVYFGRLAGTTDTVWARLGFYENVLTALKALVKYAEIIFYPVRLSAMYFVSPGVSLLDPMVLGGLFLFLALLGLFLWNIRKRPLVAFGAVWFFFNWLPTAGLIPISTKVADRYMYLALLGVILIVVAFLFEWGGLTRAGRPVRKPLVSALACLLVLAAFGLGAATVSRGAVWKNEKLLWEDMARKSKTDLASNHMAQYHLARKEWARAEDYYRQSLRMDPTQTEIWNNLGNVLVLQNKPAEAEAALAMALSRGEGDTSREAERLRQGTLLNLSVALAMQSKYAQAEKFLSRLVQEEPKAVKGWELLAEVLLAEKKYQEVVKTAGTLAALTPTKAKPYVYLAFAYQSLGEGEKAKAAYQKAMELEPEVAKRYFTPQPSRK